ncbi:MAG: hydantoinase B/oxoprolinase family protein [Geminicoccaceae bacterium]
MPPTSITRPSAAAPAPAPTTPGTAAVHTHMTNSRLTDPEILEWRYPVLLEEHRIRRGSGGRGRFAGGDGTLRRIRFLEPMSAALLSNHRKVPLRPRRRRGRPVRRPMGRAPGGRGGEARGLRRHGARGRRRLRHPDADGRGVWQGRLTD